MFPEFQENNCRIRRNLTALIGVVLTAVCFRLYLVGFVTPQFSPADNPIAHNDSFMTRTLSFLYLPLFNIFLLIIPTRLSFDWSIDSLSLVESFLDCRSLVSLAFYTLLLFVCYGLCKFTNDENCSKSRSESPATISRSPSPKFDLNANRIDVNPNYALCDGFQCKKPAKKSKKTRACEETVEPKHSRTILFSLVFIVFTFLPATNFFTYVGFIVAERVLYLPSVGYCIIVASGLEIILDTIEKCQYPKWLRTVVYACFLTTLIGFCGRTWIRNYDWRDEYSLYRSGIAISPAKGELIRFKRQIRYVASCFIPRLSFEFSRLMLRL